MLEFHMGHGKNAANTDPMYDKPYGSRLPRLQAHGNLTYLQFIDVLTSLWNNTNPEIPLVPLGGKQKWDPEKGYVVYSKDMAEPKENFIKPKLQEVVDSETGIKVMVFTQSINRIVRFTAVHSDPRVAEEIVESFDDFMLWVTGILKQAGLEECVMDRSPRDELERRFGEDVSARSTRYLIVTQKILTLEVATLQRAYIIARSAVTNSHATPTGEFIRHNIE